MTFKDNFSTQAATYARFRPRYPDSLFRYLASLCSDRKLAWDCGTGNGQCAVSLIQFFDSVIATDASEQQLAKAERDPRIDYRVASAEQSGLPSSSVDLITAAQALHWFRIDVFWSEAQRILHENAIVAVWCYTFLEATPEIDSIVHRFYDETVGPYWDFERKLVEDGYRSVSFPFAELDPPAFAIKASWSLEHLLGYLKSWSATQKFIAVNGQDPVELVSDDLIKAWGDPDRVRPVQWPISLRVGRNNPQKQ